MNNKIWVYSAAVAIVICAAFIRLFSSEASVAVMSYESGNNGYGITLCDLAETCFAKQFCD